MLIPASRVLNFTFDEKMKIRPYQNSDEKALVQLWLDCGLVSSSNNPNQDIQRKLKVNPEWFLVGTEKEKIVASCMVGYEGHRGWINYLAVAPRKQRKGYATQIMNEAEALLRDTGCPKINLQIRSTNRDVIEFYKSLGFRDDKVTSLGKRLEKDEVFQVEQGGVTNSG